MKEKKDVLADVKSKIEELRGCIHAWNFQYYGKDNPQVPDKVYDRYFEELKAMEEKFPQFYSPNSPTQKVGHEVVSKLEKKRHLYTMLSLDKSKSIDGVVIWASKIGAKKVVASHKADGLALELCYVYDDSIGKSKLETATTRGDGVIGEVVTHNVRTFENVPAVIDVDHDVVIYGEGVIKKEQFKKINDSLPAEACFKNPRNLSSGSIRQLDSNVCSKRELIFVAYGAKGFDFEYESDLFQFLDEIGFTVISHEVIDCNESSFKKYAQKVEKLIQDDKLLFNIDGVVFKLNDISRHENIGYTDHHPKFALCYKFEDDEFETVLRKIEFNVSRTGRVNPVAIFDAVVIDGTDVGRATLNNVDFIKQLELGVGDKIVVRKSNMIIPEIVENLDRSNTFKMSSTCPSCGGALTKVRKDSVDFYYCMNKGCVGKLVSKLDASLALWGA